MNKFVENIERIVAKTIKIGKHIALLMLLASCSFTNRIVDSKEHCIETTSGAEVCKFTIGKKSVCRVVDYDTSFAVSCKLHKEAFELIWEER